MLLLAAADQPEAFPFAPWFTEHGVAVSIARLPQGPPWVRGEGSLDAAAAEVFRILTDYGRYRDLFEPFVTRASVLERLPAGARLHLVWSYPLPFRNRDAVVLYEHGETAEGGFRIVWRTAARPGDPSEGVRIARVAGDTRIERLASGRSRVTYTYLGDLGGRFPRRAEEKAWRREPVEYFLALRRFLGLPSGKGPS